jgi:SAM-dependent methyltransferase
MTTLIADAWSAAAGSYAATWAPRFAPWVSDAVDALTAHARPAPPPPGHLLALGCGPGGELAALADAFPGREVVAKDLSPAMVRLARQAAGGRPGVRVEVGDARVVVAAHPAPPALLFSAFLLQALPASLPSLTAWVASLPPGGLASVLWWPPPAGQGDAAWAAVTAGPQGGGGGTDGPAAIAAAVAAGGGTILCDASPTHPMRFPSRAALADALVRGGPLTVAGVVDGEAARARAAAAAALARGDEGGGGVVVVPSARLVVVRKGGAVGEAAAVARL